MIFINTTNPNFRVYNPATGGFAEFIGGKLELDPGDENFDVVLAESQANPAVNVLENETSCPYDGETFRGKKAREDLAKHTQETHPDVWVAQQDLAHAEYKARVLKHTEGYACDVCQPVQTFGTPDDLTEHVRAFHTQPPELDAEGKEVAGQKDDAPGRRPGEKAIPAARASRRAAAAE